jgi:hypothetical protein
VIFDGSFAVGAVRADAPPAIAKDTPAIPAIGTALLRRFRFAVGFARGIVETSLISSQSKKKEVILHRNAIRFALSRVVRQ